MHKVNWDFEELRFFAFGRGDRCILAASCSGDVQGPDGHEHRGFYRAEVFVRQPENGMFAAIGITLRTRGLEDEAGTPPRDALSTAAEAWILAEVERQGGAFDDRVFAPIKIEAFRISSELGGLYDLALAGGPVLMGLRTYSAIEPAKVAANRAAEWAERVKVYSQSFAHTGPDRWPDLGLDAGPPPA